MVSGFSNKKIDKIKIVNASIDEVWGAWTTVSGAKEFFAPEARIDLRLGGRYEILFDLSQPEGSQGSEGVKVLSFVPK